MRKYTAIGLFLLASSFACTFASACEWGERKCMLGSPMVCMCSDGDCSWGPAAGSCDGVQPRDPVPISYRTVLQPSPGATAIRFDITKN
jgi:hypothetical protein